MALRSNRAQYVLATDSVKMSTGRKMPINTSLDLSRLPKCPSLFGRFLGHRIRLLEIESETAYGQEATASEIACMQEKAHIQARAAFEDLGNADADACIHLDEGILYAAGDMLRKGRIKKSVSKHICVCIRCGWRVQTD
jgi:hypothetical protein